MVVWGLDLGFWGCGFQYVGLEVWGPGFLGVGAVYINIAE